MPYALLKKCCKLIYWTAWFHNLAELSSGKAAETCYMKKGAGLDADLGTIQHSWRSNKYWVKIRIYWRPRGVPQSTPVESRKSEIGRILLGIHGVSKERKTQKQKRRSRAQAFKGLSAGGPPTPISTEQLELQHYPDHFVSPLLQLPCP